MVDAPVRSKFRWPRFLTPLLLLAGIILAMTLSPFLRPLLPASDRCHPQGLPTVKNLAISVCVDPGTWSWIETFQRVRQSFSEGPHKIYFDTIGQIPAFPLPEFRAAIIKYVEQYATNGESMHLLREGETTLGGRPWQVIEFESNTASIVDYYYSAEGFGSIQLFFLSFKQNVADRDALAAPILASVSFAAQTVK